MSGYNAMANGPGWSRACNTSVNGNSPNAMPDNRQRHPGNQAARTSDERNRISKTNTARTFASKNVAQDRSQHQGHVVPDVDSGEENGITVVGLQCEEDFPEVVCHDRFEGVTFALPVSLMEGRQRRLRSPVGQVLQSKQGWPEDIPGGEGPQRKGRMGGKNIPGFQCSN